MERSSQTLPTVTVGHSVPGPSLFLGRRRWEDGGVRSICERWTRPLRTLKLPHLRPILYTLKVEIRDYKIHYNRNVLNDKLRKLLELFTHNSSLGGPCTSFVDTQPFHFPEQVVKAPNFLFGLRLVWGRTEVSETLTTVVLLFTRRDVSSLPTHGVFLRSQFL